MRPGVENVTVTDFPTSRGLAWSGDGSSNCTVWGKLSLFVKVTVVPALTVIAAGSKRYDFGRSTWFVATGEAPVPAAGAHAAATRPDDASISPASSRTRPRARRTWRGTTRSRLARRRDQRALRRRDEHEHERDEVEDLADRVGEQERRPVQVVGHVADLGQREQRESVAQQRSAAAQRPVREV